MTVEPTKTHHGIDSLLATPLWYNTSMISWKIPNLVEKGITTIRDLIDENGDIYSIEDI